QSPLCQVPGSVPSKLRFVEQNPHQFRHRHCRVRIVELYGDLFRKRRPVGIAALETPYEIGERAGHQKIFLDEAQALPHPGGVVGIEEACEGFGFERLGHRTNELPVTERLKVEVIGRRCGPEAERIDGFATVTYHGTIERNTDQTRWASRNRAQAAAADLEGAIKFDFNPFLRASNLPRIRKTEPVVRLLLLPPILDGLLKDAVFVPQ